MRTLSPAMLAHLQGDVQTICTLWKITRQDGKVFGFTDLDQPITYQGLTYQSAGGYIHSQIDAKNDLSTGNLEIAAIFDSSAIARADLEAGLWDYAAVSTSLVNYNDLTMGAVILNAGTLGQMTFLNGQFKAEQRGLAQQMQQAIGQTYSPTCRATLGDARCKVALGPLTAAGSVQSLNSAMSWTESTLTQTGPTVTYTDTRGQKIPTTGPYTIKVAPPTGGAFVASVSVTDATGAVWTVGSGAQQYTVAGDGTYTFNSADAGWEVFLSYTYSIGYFAYGKVTFTTGQNSGYTGEVKSFAPGVVTLALPMPFPIGVGDAYTIVAGCDRSPGTCNTRFSNIVNFRGEPYIPGPDTILRPQSS